MIQLFKPSIGQEEIDAIVEVLKSGWLGLGPRTAEFEKRFAEYIGVNFTIGVNSCTSALDLALKLLDIRHGDEVIVPTMTFVSTAHVVVYNMATPIFVDVNEDTITMDLDDVKRKITNKTKAIIPVHYSGRAVDIDKLKEIAGPNIKIIEDCAHACGAEYKGRRCGSLGDIGCFSFHAVKNLTTGDGGALTLNDEKIAQRAKRLRWLGIDKGTWDRTELDKKYWWEYFVDEIGLKCHMNDIQAALGLVQLKRLESMNKKRREIVQKYNDVLKNIDAIKLPPKDDNDYKSSWHIYFIKCKKRDELSSYLQNNGIITGVHYKPIHLYKCYGDKPSLPVAEKVFKEILSLPLYPDMTEEEINKVVNMVKSFAKEKL